MRMPRFLLAIIPAIFLLGLIALSPRPVPHPDWQRLSPDAPDRPDIAAWDSSRHFRIGCFPGDQRLGFALSDDSGRTLLPGHRATRQVRFTLVGAHGGSSDFTGTARYASTENVLYGALPIPDPDIERLAQSRSLLVNADGEMVFLSAFRNSDHAISDLIANCP